MSMIIYMHVDISDDIDATIHIHIDASIDMILISTFVFLPIYNFMLILI